MRLTINVLVLCCFLFLEVPVILAQEASSSEKFQIDYETFSLDNGLQVIFHVDRSDPVVAVALTSHVGSAREKPGRTGFAHLFEHLLFLESENLGKGGLDKLSARIGGSGANGSTSRDRTNYFQTVPKDALEKMIWAEADKLGYFINTVTEPVLAKEKQVVKNEKRQGVDNVPYGHTMEVIDKNLYPEGHPYHWQVIGSLEDLQNATLQDVKDFYNRWYVPNNVILTIAGDFDKEQARNWVEKYFGGIPRGPEVKRFEKQPVKLEGIKKRYYEDNFARLPELTMAWPSVPSYHEDSYALEVLATYLSEGESAPFYKELVEDEQLVSNVDMFNYTSELAGQFMLQARAYQDKDLDSVMAGVHDAFRTFEKQGISEEDLERIKAGQERAFYEGLSSVLGKGFQLAQYEIFANDPGLINKEVDKILSVTQEDVMRVYKKYLKDRNYVAASFVPQGRADLALTGSEKAEVEEEQILMGAEEEVRPDTLATYEKTPSSFDRSIEPPYGKKPLLEVPKVWEVQVDKGLELLGITHSEVPLVEFSLEIEGGMLLEDEEKTGVANLMALLMEKGTEDKTPEELEQAIEELGADIDIYATDQKTILRGTTLAKNFEPTMDLVEEILLEPRWDQKEFDLLRQQVLSRIEQEKASPGSIASNEFRKLIYGSDNILSKNNIGTAESLEKIQLQDLRAYYDNNITPQHSSLLVVGDITKEEALESAEDLVEDWEKKEVSFPEIDVPAPPQESQLFFYDVPGAKQSVFMFGYPALAETHPDYYPATLMNYRLGGGGFASQLTQELREGKGYTYGIRSSFQGTQYPGPFVITSGVRTNITLEAAQLVKEILENYPENFDQQDLEVTKSYMIKSKAREFETLSSKLQMLRNISDYQWEENYIKEQEEIVERMTVESIKKLAEQYADPGRMYYLIVGDAATQLERLDALDLGTPTLLNPKKQASK